MLDTWTYGIWSSGVCVPKKKKIKKGRQTSMLRSGVDFASNSTSGQWARKRDRRSVERDGRTGTAGLGIIKRPSTQQPTPYKISLWHCGHVLLPSESKKLKKITKEANKNKTNATALKKIYIFCFSFSLIVLYAEFAYAK